MNRSPFVLVFGAIVACSSAATEPGPGPSPSTQTNEKKVRLEGDYRASDSADFASMVFDKEGAYARRSAACGAQDPSCVEHGTFALNDAQTTLTLTSSDGQVKRFAFEAIARPSDVATQSVSPLDRTGAPSTDEETGDNGGSLLGESSSLIKAIAEAFKIKGSDGEGWTTLVAFGPMGTSRCPGGGMCMSLGEVGTRSGCTLAPSDCRDPGRSYCCSGL